MSDELMKEAEAGVGLEAGKIITLLGQNVQTLGKGGTPFVLTTDEIKRVDLEAVLPAPARKRGEVAIRTADSFIDYAKRFGDANSLVFANIGDRTITAVLDYHEQQDGGPRWGQHRAQLTCLLTEDWKRWMAANGKKMDQLSFAQFLEDNLPNIAAPEGSFVLEVVKNLEAKKAVKFESSVRLDNGQHQLTYEETVTGQAKGHIDIPQTFTLGLEPFDGAGLYRVEARLRYRIDGGKLVMWFDLMRPETVVEDAFRKAKDSIASGIAPIAMLAAAAPATQK